MRKVDPGTFSFLQTGWWVWHTAAIAGAVLLGKQLADRDRKW